MASLRAAPMVELGRGSEPEHAAFRALPDRDPT